MGAPVDVPSLFARPDQAVAVMTADELVRAFGPLVGPLSLAAEEMARRGFTDQAARDAMSFMFSVYAEEDDDGERVGG